MLIAAGEMHQYGPRRRGQQTEMLAARQSRHARPEADCACIGEMITAAIQPWIRV
jgi:hypothetical protein